MIEFFSPYFDLRLWFCLKNILDRQESLESALKS